MWTLEQIEELNSLHGTMPNAAIADRIGVSRPALRGMVTRQGLAKKTVYSAETVAAIRAAYETAGASGCVDAESLGKRLGIYPGNISREARKMGLTNPNRTRKDDPAYKRPRVILTTAERSSKAKEWHANNPHPRGMLGKHHTQATKDHLSVTSAKWMNDLSVDEKAAWSMGALKAKVAKHGTLAVNVKRGSWKAGWREIGGYRKFYRSRWEANYARYLQWLVNRGDILDWKHEPETFWFEAIKRGVRSYLPDFRVWELDESSRLHEVKGWMDARSKTTLKRMAKYYPGETIVLVDTKAYREIEKRLGRLIEGWES